jgi:RNAse (barnase) inhibitor barstar
MTQQPILTADEVLETLRKEIAAHNKNLLGDFKRLAKSDKLVSGYFDDPHTEIPLIEHCANLLRSKGIHVYLDINDAINDFTFIAGECGRVIDEMCKLEEYLRDLVWFIEDNKDTLPPEVVAAEKAKLETYWDRLCDEVIFPLEVAYFDGDKAAIQALLEKAAKLVEEINEGTKEWQRAYALAKSL